MASMTITHEPTFEESQAMRQQDTIQRNAMPPASPLVNDREAAAILNMAVDTLRRWRWKGRGPKYYRFGRSIRYAVADLDDFRDRHLVTPSINTRR